MKVRNGFVSNSSSSSFIIIGKQIELKDIDTSSGKKYYFEGKSLCDGDDFFEANEEMIGIMKFIPNFTFDEYGPNSFNYYEVAELTTCIPVIKEEHIGLEVITMEVDYHTTTHTNDFIRNYNIPDNALRALKIKRVLKDE